LQLVNETDALQAYASSARYESYAAMLPYARVMRSFLPGSRMVRRTCLDCGESWTLERSLAHLRPGRPRGFGGGLLTIRGYSQLGEGLAEQQAAGASAGLDAELETVRQLRTCPKCGSDHFKDARA
jgi:hypothetical protein